MKVRDVLRQKTPLSQDAHTRSSEVLAAEVVQTVSMPHPIYIDHAKGARVTDVDGNEYIDLTMGYGSLVLGHAPDCVVDAVQAQASRGLHYGLHNPRQAHLAELISEACPNVEETVFTNSGTEATMYAVRAARAYTGKNGIGIFDGSYHGVHDTVLAGVVPNSPRDTPTARAKGAGIPDETLAAVFMLPYRSTNAFDLIRKNKNTLAAILVEPVQSSNPRLDTKEWLLELRAVCDECGVLLVFDEVITGFRMAYGGIQELFDVKADIVTYGKALGGGTPIGAVCGGREIMSVFGPGARASTDGKENSSRIRIFAGTTFAGNPLTMSAAIAAMCEMRDRKQEIYPYLEEQTRRLVDTVNTFLTTEKMAVQMRHAGSMFHMPFQLGEISTSRDVRGERMELENEFYMHLLNNGVVVPGVHLAFLSAAHTADDVGDVIDAYIRSFQELRNAGHI